MANSVRLVAVSICGAPGTALSVAFGSGAAGGMIVTGLRVRASMPRPARAWIGPLCARIGTPTETLRSDAAVTGTDTSSRPPGAPR